MIIEKYQEHMNDIYLTIQNLVRSGKSCSEIANYIMEKHSPQVFIQVEPEQLHSFMYCLAQQAYLVINKEYESE
jgi:hypothetical protein